MDGRYEWVRARDELVRNIERLGFPAELGEEIAKNLGSPKAMERMNAYLFYVKPRSAELIVDDAKDCDKLLVMHQGKMVEYGATDEIMNRSTNEITRKLIANYRNEYRFKLSQLSS